MVIAYFHTQFQFPS